MRTAIPHAAAVGPRHRGARLRARPVDGHGLRDLVAGRPAVGSTAGSRRPTRTSLDVSRRTHAGDDHPAARRDGDHDDVALGGHRRLRARRSRDRDRRQRSASATARSRSNRPIPSRSPDNDYNYLVIGARLARASATSSRSAASVAFEPVFGGDGADRDGVRRRVGAGRSMSARALECARSPHVFARARGRLSAVLVVVGRRRRRAAPVVRSDSYPSRLALARHRILGVDHEVSSSLLALLLATTPALAEVKKGDHFVELDAKSAAGKPFHLKDMAGKWVLFTFGASWCAAVPQGAAGLGQGRAEVQRQGPVRLGEHQQQARRGQGVHRLA